MNDMRICAVVTGKTKEEFLGNLEKIQKVADFIELRVDYINGFSVSDIDLIKRKSYGADCKSAPAKIKYIFTCRKKEEGGFFSGSENERKEILERAMKAGFDYVDVELAAAGSLFEKSRSCHPDRAQRVEGSHSVEQLCGVRFTTRVLPISLQEDYLLRRVAWGRLDSFLARNDRKNISQKSLKIILSFHDFEKTPSLAELNEIKKQMKIYSPDIMKFATLVRNDADSKILFQFLLNKQDNEKMIVAGMGEEGKSARVFGPLLGSYLTYASTSYSSSASGQIDINKLKKLYNELGEF